MSETWLAEVVGDEWAVAGARLMGTESKLQAAELKKFAEGRAVSARRGGATMMVSGFDHRGAGTERGGGGGGGVNPL